jgi:hypothetical protein
MRNIEEFSVKELRSEIGSLNNGMMPCVGGFTTCDKDVIREELKRRGEQPFGFHEHGYVDDEPRNVEHRQPTFLTVCIGI